MAYQNYRHTIRLQKLDYSLPNQYFVTICALRHGCYFEKYPQLVEVINKNFNLLPPYFPNIIVENKVIMPNHIHFIITIKYQIKDVTLGKIIDVFKGRVVNNWLKIIQSQKNNATACVWQRNYYEHRIRNETEYKRYSKYIDLNPILWKKDKYNPKNFKKHVGASLAEAQKY